VAEALARFSLDPRSDNETFNIGNTEPVTVKHLAAKVVALGKELSLLPASYQLSFQHEPVYGDDVRRRIPDITRIRQAFGWEPRIRVDESLRAYILHRHGPAAS
jgi:nucleoside-diphosphate-sugar epimerase